MSNLTPVRTLVDGDDEVLTIYTGLGDLRTASLAAYATDQDDDTVTTLSVSNGTETGYCDVDFANILPGTNTSEKQYVLEVRSTVGAVTLTSPSVEGNNALYAVRPKRS